MRRPAQLTFCGLFSNILRKIIPSFCLSSFVTNSSFKVIEDNKAAREKKYKLLENFSGIFLIDLLSKVFFLICR